MDYMSIQEINHSAVAGVPKVKAVSEVKGIAISNSNGWWSTASNLLNLFIQRLNPEPKVKRSSRTET